MTRRVAAFDFDGTVSRRDTLVPFLALVGGRTKFARVAAQLGLLGVQRRVDLTDRDGAKAEMVRLLLGGRSEDELRSRGETYARDLLSDQLRPEVVTRIDVHRDRGDDVLFVSASLVYYLDPLAETFGLHGVLAVEPSVVDGRLTGELSRPNVRAEQKAIRLREWLGAPPDGAVPDTEIWAYGNSSGDHALLEMADHRWWLGRPSKCPAGAAPFRPGRLTA